MSGHEKHQLQQQLLTKNLAEKEADENKKKEAAAKKKAAAAAAKKRKEDALRRSKLLHLQPRGRCPQQQSWFLVPKNGDAAFSPMPMGCSQLTVNPHQMTSADLTAADWQICKKVP